MSYAADGVRVHRCVPLRAPIRVAWCVCVIGKALGTASQQASEACAGVTCCDARSVAVRARLGARGSRGVSGVARPPVTTRKAGIAVAYTRTSRCARS